MSPTENFARINMDQLWLPYLQKVLNVVARCKARGCNYVATVGYRTFVESNVLSVTGKVRAAPGGKSPHNFGIGTDFARIEHGQYLKDAADYLVLGEEVRAEPGLAWGGDFKHGQPDWDHVNLAGFSSGEELEPLRAVYEAHLGDDPLSHVFEYLDAQGGSHVA